MYTRVILYTRSPHTIIIHSHTLSHTHAQVFSRTNIHKNTRKQKKDIEICNCICVTYTCICSNSFYLRLMLHLQETKLHWHTRNRKVHTQILWHTHTRAHIRTYTQSLHTCLGTIQCTHTNRHPNVTHTLGNRCRNHSVDNEWNHSLFARSFFLVAIVESD